MPTFEFTSPEGKKFSVDGPPGATKEQAFQVLQARLAGGEVAPQVAGVPGADPSALAGNRNVGQAPADPSLVDRIIGSGETALSMATGATTGLAGLVGGGLVGVGKSVVDGTFGTQKGVQTAEQAAAEGMGKFTYAPRTEEGQHQTEAWGNLLNSTLPLAPLTAEMGALGRGATAARGAVSDLAAASNAPLNAADAALAAAPKAPLRDLVRTPKGSPEAPVVSQIRKVSPAIADRVQRTLERNPDPEPTPGTKPSVGAAGTDMATQRRQVGDDIGVDLTLGQATRDQQQLRFEHETAKGENGAAIRDRYSQQNEQIGKHFDNLVDKTGAEAADLIGTGRAVDQALRDKAAADKARIRVAYKEAEKAGELEAPVELSGLVDHLNESAPDAATAPVLNTARARALQLGIAAEDANGQLVATPTSLANAERYRQAIGRATDFEPTNVRQAVIIKGAIDTATDGMGGNLYRTARRLRENFAKQYEDRAVVDSLLNNKRGMADRKVALEDVFDHIVLKGDRADVGHVRRVLQTGGETGQQAWRELQGATVNWIKNEAFSNTATDQRGNVILSVAKLDKAIKRLEDGNKLDFIFGKQGAQHFRDMNDLAKVIYTTPPGAVNHSNTASVLLAALTEAGVTGSMTGLPVPVLSALRMASIHVKNRRIQKRIEQALSRSQATTTTPQPARPAGITLH